MSKKNKGFSLIEILVSISIITLLMMVTIYDYSKFNDRLSLTEAGQEMLIAVRQAQSYSVNVRETSSGSNDFEKAYGIYFDPVNSPSAYYIFVDQDGNKKYSDTLGGCGGMECIEKINLDRGTRITSVVKGAAMSGVCSVSTPDFMTVVFNRPSPIGNISFFTNGGLSCFSRQSGQVVLTSGGGQTITLTIYFSGQVSVQ